MKNVSAKRRKLIDRLCHEAEKQRRKIGMAAKQFNAAISHPFSPVFFAMPDGFKIMRLAEKVVQLGKADK